MQYHANCKTSPNLYGPKEKIPLGELESNLESIRL